MKEEPFWNTMVPRQKKAWARVYHYDTRKKLSFRPGTTHHSILGRSH
jgi:hypothetical protein